jgi:hypothetical protein
MKFVSIGAGELVANMEKANIIGRQARVNLCNALRILHPLSRCQFTS